MAILHSVPAIEITIHVAGELAVEYKNTDLGEGDLLSPLPVTRCYIESRDNAEFFIRLEVSKDYDWDSVAHDIGFEVVVDGKTPSEWVLSKGIASYDIVGRSLKEDGTVKVARFKFASITTVPLLTAPGSYLVEDADQERVKRDRTIVKGMGTIEVRVFRLGSSELPPRLTPSLSPELSPEVAEKALKGKSTSHLTSYGSAGFLEGYEVNPGLIEQDNGPIAIYRFHYLSRRALQHEFIVPRSLQKEESPEASDARIEAIKSESAQIKSEPEQLKQELSAVKKDPEVKQEESEVIMEHIPEAGVSAVGSADLPIDLTDD
ncbi:hypothetical protein PG997_013619 [Apiospora hydei]|uniref:DUF7918 domain-containing protein n=1 Tax=Apiospora hydei TaxID=1337664 RepID=A0ABR1V6N3_9PEZI